MAHHSTGGRHFLQIPGPTNVPDRVLRAIDRPTIDHRGAEFAALGREVLEGLKSVFRTGQPVVIYPASGTGAWVATTACRRTPPPGGDRARRLAPFDKGTWRRAACWLRWPGTGLD